MHINIAATVIAAATLANAAPTPYTEKQCHAQCLSRTFLDFSSTKWEECMNACTLSDTPTLAARRLVIHGNPIELTTSDENEIAKDVVNLDTSNGSNLFDDLPDPTHLEDSKRECASQMYEAMPDEKNRSPDELCPLEKYYTPTPFGNTDPCYEYFDCVWNLTNGTIDNLYGVPEYQEYREILSSLSQDER
ncbi:hypothetical protein LTR22_024325 [Elasticomyces elasticus]|nr:hypothetical protein LTR22_024325 [Elasticomyces elasticus]KAK4917976.1 hypothetical protein LTR49_014251 [Elasticomyces elasticus]KAK5743924.1 hypothetical protein LTS12_023651 [Elasticomyces elasticus]